MGQPLILSDVPNETPYIQYVATSNQTTFPYPFPITQDSDLVVVANGATLATDSGYSLTGQGNDTGGNVVFSVGRTAGDIITLYRDIAIQRITQIGQNSGFSSTVFNAEFNQIYLIMQQLEQSITQCLQMPVSNSPTPTTTLLPANYANKYLGFDANGNPTPAAAIAVTTLTQALIAGLLIPQTTAEATAGVTPTNYQYQPYDIRRYGGDPTATNASDAAMTAAIAVCGATGGTIRLPNGKYKFASQIALNVKTTIVLLGDGGGSAGNQPATEIVYTGTASPFMNWNSSVGIELRDLAVSTSNASFTGTVIKCSNDGTHSDPAFCAVRRCLFFAASATGVTTLDLDKCIEFTIEGCVFSNGNPNVSLAASGSYANSIRIRDSQFANSFSHPIQGGAQALEIRGCVFEGSGGVLNTPSQAVLAASAGQQLIGFIFENNWLGDAGSAAGTWIDIFAEGGKIAGNYFSGNQAASSAITLRNSFGISIENNFFTTLLNGISFASGGNDIIVKGNVSSTITNPWVNGNQISTGGIDFGPNFGFGIPGTNHGLQANSGYRVMSDGTIFQWGVATNQSHGANTVTFPLAFPSAAYNVTATLSAVSSGSATIQVSALGTTGFTATITDGTSTTDSFYWTAIGK